MEKIIELLVEFDQKGQQIVQEAQEERRNVLTHMNDYKQALSTQFLERSAHRVETFRQQVQSDQEEQLWEVRKSFEEQSGRLRASYEKNRDQWLKEIVDRCIGG